MATTALNPQQKAFLDIARTPWKMRLYFWRHLPSVAFWQMKVHEIQAESCSILLPFNWRTQNPFRSIYFSAQAGAAELSSGLLAVLALRGRPPVSMLVTDFSMTFVKKATGQTYFQCNAGHQIFEAVERCLQTGEGQKIVVQSTARMADGTEVSKAEIHWSFKAKAKNN